MPSIGYFHFFSWLKNELLESSKKNSSGEVVGLLREKRTIYTKGGEGLTNIHS